MKAAVNFYLAQLLLSIVAAYVGSQVQLSSMPEVIVVFVVLVLTGCAVATKKGLEAYSSVLCSMSILSALLCGVMPASNPYLNAVVISLLVPSIMLIMETGSQSSLLWRLALQKGEADGVNKLMNGDTGNKERDESIAFLRKMFDDVKPTNLRDATALASSYNYTDKDLVKQVFHRYKTHAVASGMSRQQKATKQSQRVLHRPQVPNAPGAVPGRHGGF